MDEQFKKSNKFSSLPIYIILVGWVGFLVYTAIFFDTGDGQPFLNHFLSTEHSGVKFRALVFFLPFICTVIGFLVNEREKLIRKILSSEEKYRDLFQNANDPLFIVDYELNYLDVNAKAIETFGYTQKEFLDMNVRDLVPKELVAELSEKSSQTHKSSMNDKYISKMRTKDGRILDIEISSSTIVKEGKVLGSREIVRDITDLKRMQDELNSSYKNLESLIEEKTSKLMDTQKRLLIEIRERKKAEAALQNITRSKEN